MYGFERENRTEDASRPENCSKCANNYVHLNDSFSCPMYVCTKVVGFLFCFLVCVWGVGGGGRGYVSIFSFFEFEFPIADAATLVSSLPRKSSKKAGS